MFRDIDKMLLLLFVKYKRDLFYKKNKCTDFVVQI